MAGAGYKLFTTGQVLTAAEVNTYLQEQTVMVFNDAASRTTALSGVLAEGMVSYLKSTKVVEIYNGTAWASLDDPNAIQNTIVDAKGDLIAATGNDVPARLAVGNNGETLVADSSTSTGLRYTAGNAVGNPVLNSSFQIWQRGTSFAVNAATYTADRWMGYRGAAGMTVSRQTTSDTTNLPNIQYAARIQRDSGNTGTGLLQFGQAFETINSIPYAGKIVTLSFYARKGANYSPTASDMTAYIVTGTGTDQNYLTSGYTGLAFPLSVTATLTTTWQRFTATATLSTSMTEMGVLFVSGTPVGTAGANDWFEVTGFQVDLGSTALPYRTYSATLAGELAACQRYFVAYGGNQNYEAIPGFGNSRSTTTHYIVVPYPQMRTTPSYSLSAATDWAVTVTGVATQECTAISLSTGESGPTAALLTATTNANASLGGSIAIRFVADNTTAARMFFSAEL